MGFADAVAPAATREGDEIVERVMETLRLREPVPERDPDALVVVEGVEAVVWPPAPPKRSRNNSRCIYL